MKKGLRKWMAAGVTALSLSASVLPVMAETKAAEAYTVEVETGYLALRSAPAYNYNNELEAMYTGDTFYVMYDYDDTYVYGYTEDGREGYANKNYLVEAYSIARGITTRASQGASFLETDEFSLYLPGDISWEYEVIDNTAIAIYYTPAKEDEYGGHVVTIRAYDWGENDYEEFPAWSIAGMNDEKKFVAIYPTDVQFDPNDSVQASEYERLMKVAERMNCQDEELAKDNPFEIINDEEGDQ